MLPNHLLLFDGVCNLCNGLVQFVIKHDKKKKFRFSSLQSKFVQEELKVTKIDTVVYLRNQEALRRSTAVIYLLTDLFPLAFFLKVFLLIPYPLRDLLYKIVANNRYKMFGKRDSCMLPDPKLKDRFLE